VQEKLKKKDEKIRMVRGRRCIKSKYYSWGCQHVSKLHFYKARHVSLSKSFDCLEKNNWFRHPINCGLKRHVLQLLVLQTYIKSNMFHIRALSHTKTLITNKCTKRVLSSIVTHSYMFRPCTLMQP
jgi:hypothetical protein